MFLRALQPLSFRSANIVKPLSATQRAEGRGKEEVVILAVSGGRQFQQGTMSTEEQGIFQNHFHGGTVER